MKNQNYRKPFILGMIATTTVTSLVSLANVDNIPGFNIFTSGSVISSSQMNQNFDLINQKIDNIGAVTYVGTYDASLGVDPGAGNAGDYYIIDSGGIINSTNYVVGDWIVFNGTVWEQVQQGGIKVNKAGDTMTGDLILDTQLKFKGGANYVTLKASAATANYTMNLPTTAGTNGYLLQTDGTGVLSWINPSTINTGAATVNSTSIVDGSITNADIMSSSITYSKLLLADGDIPTTKLSGTNDTTKYLRGDKTWSIFSTDTINSVIDTYTVGTGTKPAIANTDSIVGAFGKVQKNLNDINTELPVAPTAGDAGKWLKANGANSTSWSLLSMGDIVAGIGYTPVNKNGDTINSGIFNFTSTAVIRTLDPVGVTDVATKQYVDAQVATASNQWTHSAGNIYRSTGSIGVGTTTPTMKMDIITNGGDGLQLSAGNGHSVMKLHSYSSNTNDGALLHLYKASGAVGSPAAVPGASLLGQLRFGGYNGSNFTNAATIEAWANSTFTGASSEAILKFTTTANGSVTPTERMRITSDGKIGIGTSSPSSMLTVQGDIQIFGNGNMSGTLTQASDKRFKENITVVNNALEKIKSIHGVSYNFTKKAQADLHRDEKRDLGVIAQEVKKVFPEAVRTDSNGMLSVAYSMLISPLIEAVKELDKKVSVENKALKEENAAIKNYLCEKDPHAPFCSN